MSKKNKVIENVEVVTEVAEEVSDVAVTEEAKVSFVSKLGNGVKALAPKIAKVAIVGAAGIAGYVLGTKLASKHDGDSDEDILDADYDVLEPYADYDSSEATNE